VQARTWLQVGKIVDRYGSTAGRFLTDYGVPFGMRGLPPSAASAPYAAYYVLKPIELWAGPIAAAFGSPGGATQYLSPVPIQVLIDRGFLFPF
jgi:hypothetical protein